MPFEKLQASSMPYRILALPHLSCSAIIEKVAWIGLLRQHTSVQGIKDDFLGEISLNAHLDWFLASSMQWLSTGSAEDPTFDMTSSRLPTAPSAFGSSS